MKCALAVVAVKRGSRRLFSIRDMPRPVGGVDEEQILVPVVVKIEEGHAAAHGFGQQLLAVSAGIVGEVNARCGCDVGELHRRDGRFALDGFRGAEGGDLVSVCTVFARIR